MVDLIKIVLEGVIGVLVAAILFGFTIGMLNDIQEQNRDNNMVSETIEQGKKGLLTFFNGWEIADALAGAAIFAVAIGGSIYGVLRFVEPSL